ncbi:MAG: hypothetical protein QM808_05820 [Steroidobacteraceae bacterium]
MRMLKLIVVVAIAMLNLSAQAAKAPWYLWRHQVDGVAVGKDVCAQQMQGSWMIMGGPFQDDRCKVPGLPD